MKKTAEAVSLGHPDKMADYISSYILDRMIEQDAAVKYAVEVMVKDNTVVLGGEITGDVNLARINFYVTEALAEIGYDKFYSHRWGNYAINPEKLQIINLIGKQSADISQGVEQDGWVIRGYLSVTLVRVRATSAANNIWPKNYAMPCMSMLCKTSTWALTSKRRLHLISLAVWKRWLWLFRRLKTLI